MSPLLFYTLLSLLLLTLKNYTDFIKNFWLDNFFCKTKVNFSTVSPLNRVIISVRSFLLSKPFEPLGKLQIIQISNLAKFVHLYNYITSICLFMLSLRKHDYKIFKFYKKSYSVFAFQLTRCMGT